MFNRKDQFQKKSSVKKGKPKANPRLTQNEIDHLQQDDLYQLRKKELEMKALERISALPRQKRSTSIAPRPMSPDGEPIRASLAPGRQP